MRQPVGFIEFSKAVLPTPASQWTAGGTVSIVSGFLALPKWWPEGWPIPKLLEQLDTRIVLSGWLLFVGSLLILVFVLFHVKNLNETISSKRGKPKVDVKKRLDKEREGILLTLIKTERLYQSGLEVDTKLEPNRALYHLVDLVETRMVDSYCDDEYFWTLAQEGRRYLVYHDLLPKKFTLAAG